MVEEAAAVSQASGFKVSLGAYTKHAVLSHARLRRMEVELRKALANEGTDSALSSGDPFETTQAISAFLTKIRAIVEAP